MTQRQPTEAKPKRLLPARLLRTAHDGGFRGTQGPDSQYDPSEPQEKDAPGAEARSCAPTSTARAMWWVHEERRSQHRHQSPGLSLCKVGNCKHRRCWQIREQEVRKGKKKRLTVTLGLIVLSSTISLCRFCRRRLRLYFCSGQQSLYGNFFHAKNQLALCLVPRLRHLQRPGPRSARIRHHPNPHQRRQLTYSYLNGGVLFNPTIPVTNATSQTNVGVISLFHTLSFFGRSASLTASLPYGAGQFQGMVTGALTEGKVYRSGLLDARFVFP